MIASRQDTQDTEIFYPATSCREAIMLILSLGSFAELFHKVMGLQGEKAFASYHRVFYRAQWDARKGLIAEILGHLAEAI